MSRAGGHDGLHRPPRTGLFFSWLASRSVWSFLGRPIANLHDRLGEILRRLLRQIVACVDDAVFMPTDEHAGMGRSPAGLQRVVRAVDRHCRRPDRGLLCKPVFERLQRGVARLEAKDAAVTVDHDIDEVGIFECDRRPGERRLIEPPAGRPFAPQDPGELAAVFGQAFAPALGLEEMLIPEDPLERRRYGRRCPPTSITS